MMLARATHGPTGWHEAIFGDDQDCHIATEKQNRMELDFATGADRMQNML